LDIGNLGFAFFLAGFCFFMDMPLYLHSQSKSGRFLKYAEVAQLVEHDLAKVGVAGSSLVFRSEDSIPTSRGGFFLFSLFRNVYQRKSDECPGGGIGRRAGLKILFAARRVRVQFPSGAQMRAEKQSEERFLRSYFLFFITLHLNSSVC
jgi:hypothetical protein